MRTTTAFLAERLGTDRVVVLDGECVDHAQDYERVLRELVHQVSAGSFSVTYFVAVQGTPRTITFALDGAEPVTFDAEGDTDWLDSPAVIRATNRLLAARGETRQLVEYHGDEFGQESGWVLLTPEELEALLEFGLYENREVTVCFGEGTRLSPASEDRGDGPEPWEDAILALLP